MITRKFPERQNLTIIPISDVHLGASEHLWNEWESFRQYVLSNPNVYITLGGDLINNGTRSSVTNVFEETIRPRDQKRMMAEMLKPIRDRILCAVSGNHERRSGKDADDDPTYDILCKLDIENRYRENIAFVKIQMGEKNSNGKLNPTYMLVVTHGSGGGVLSGGAVNRNERFGYVIDGIDGLIVGHTHKGAITKPSKVYVDKYNNKVSMKPFVVVSSVPWMNFGDYALQKMLLPATSGDPQKILLHGKQKKISLIW